MKVGRVVSQIENKIKKIPFLYHGGGFRETDGHPSVCVISRDGETDLVVPFQIFPFGVVGAVHLERVARHGILPLASAKSRTLVNVFTAATSSPATMVMMIAAVVVIASRSAVVFNLDLGLRFYFCFRVKRTKTKT